MKLGKKAAVGAGLFYSLFGFLLNPDVLAKILRKEEYEMFLMRRVAGWLSPLNHATYYMHSFGYDNLPRLWDSYGFFIAGSLFIYLLAFWRVRNYSFNFTGTER